MSQRRIIWTDYMRYRARVRGFDLRRLEEIIRYSAERYFDTATGRRVVIPYEEQDDAVIPITVHATTRRQISFRIKSGRYVHEHR